MAIKRAGVQERDRERDADPSPEIRSGLHLPRKNMVEQIMAYRRIVPFRRNPGLEPQPNVRLPFSAWRRLL